MTEANDRKFLSNIEKILMNTMQKKNIGENSSFSTQMSSISKSLYRLNILDRTYTDLLESSKKYLPNTLNACKFLIEEAITLTEIVKISPNVSIVKKDSDFDYQSSDALKIANLSTSKAPKLSPKDIAAKIIAGVPENHIIEKLEISGPGFINIKLKTKYIEMFCDSIALYGVLPPFSTPRKVVVDFSSPNIAKEMHVGHLRSTIIGESVCRIFEYLGFEVVRVSHVGDWGTQFGMLIAHLEETFPKFITDPPAISDLQQFYKDSKKRFDDDINFKKRSQLKVVSLQSGTEESVRNAWSMICDISRRDFERIYNRLEVSITEKGESFYQSRMSLIVKELEERKLIVKEENCMVIYVPGIRVPLFIVKSDGGYTYDTSDIATLKYRIFEEKADWIIYIVDIGQQDHFSTIFKLGQMMTWYDPSITRVEHIGFGLVTGENRKKFKTRSGDTIKLTDLLDEGVSRSKAKLLERGLGDRFSNEEIDKISESVGYSCIKYADLSKNLTSDYEFSFDRMLDDRGNTAVYLMYCYSRIRSIIRKSGVSQQEIVDYVAGKGIKATHESEFKLMRKLVHFPEIVSRILTETYPHYMCEYLYELSCSMTDFYEACVIINVVDKKADMNRLSQIYVASLVLKKGFDLLGIISLERM
ncbi:hypothetical protein MXB_2162 [Myxobolus squamalis]|nr:hypothetical protein MXB_2162 [Myxobolus squamalis]